MATRDRKSIRIYSDFEKNAKKAFPYKSMYQITKELNNLLENAIYGIQKKDEKKRKHN